MITEENFEDKLERLKKDIRKRFLNRMSYLKQNAKLMGTSGKYGVAADLEQQANAWKLYMEEVEEAFAQFILEQLPTTPKKEN